jgi:hypothetical protein
MQPDEATVPTVSANDSSLGMRLTEAVHNAIQQGRFEQEVTTPEGAIRFGVRDSAAGHEFFAVNPGTGTEIPLQAEPPRVTASGLTIKLNEFRRLRPASPILKPGRRPEESFAAEACRFGCQNAEAPNSILRRPVLLRIRGREGELAVIPQLAPLEPAHVLLVPRKGKDFPHIDQLLFPELVGEMFAMSAAAPGWMFVFNSMHAGATVRHLHLQGVRWADPLPIEGAVTRREQGFTIIDDPRFPAGGFLFDTAEAWHLSNAIEILQKSGYPLNLLLKAGRAFLFPRHPDHEIVASFPYSGFASMEMAGVIYTSSREAFEAATDERIEETLRVTAIGNEEALRIWLRVER